MCSIHQQATTWPYSTPTVKVTARLAKQVSSGVLRLSDVQRRIVVFVSALDRVWRARTAKLTGIDPEDGIALANKNLVFLDLEETLAGSKETVMSLHTS